MLEFMLGLITFVGAILIAGLIFFVVGPPILHWLIELLFD